MLIVVEGVHSAGKSTQVRALSRWLDQSDIPNYVSSWNSSPPIGAEITQLKIAGQLKPIAMVLMEAADLAYRYEMELAALLDDGHIIITDRYIYSGIARGLIRGVDESFLRSCFSFAPAPNLVFYVSCPPTITRERRERKGQRIDGHLCGEDHESVSDYRQAFVNYQERMHRYYETLLPAETVFLSGVENSGLVHSRVRDIVASRIASDAQSDTGARQ